MDDDMYRQYILDVYHHMQHKYIIDNATHTYTGFNASCGDQVKIFLHAEDGIIQDISFTGEGCLLSQVSAEMICAFAKGKRMKEIEEMHLDTLLDILGIHPTPTRLKCIELALVTLKKISTD